MRRFWSLILPVSLVLAGCRIEQTPQRYIDHLDTPADEIRASEEELRDRLLSIPVALQRGNLSAVSSALMPHDEARLFAPEPSRELRSSEEIVGALEVLAGDAGHLEELDVNVGPRNNVAWFRATYAFPAHDGPAPTTRFTGVFLRHDGEWRLIQGHLSNAVSQSPPPPPAAADTAAGAG